MFKTDYWKFFRFTLYSIESNPLDLDDSKVVSYFIGIRRDDQDYYRMRGTGVLLYSICLTLNGWIHIFSIPMSYLDLFLNVLGTNFKTNWRVFNFSKFNNHIMGIRRIHHRRCFWYRWYPILLKFSMTNFTEHKCLFSI